MSIRSVWLHFNLTSVTMATFNGKLCSIYLIGILVVFEHGECRSYSDDFKYLGSYTTPSSGFGLQSARTSYYHLGRGKVPWTEAYYTCQRAFSGASLVSIQTAGENSALKDLIVKDGLLNSYFWTAGVYDPASEAFRWYSTGALVDFGIPGQWAPGYPIRNPSYPMALKNLLFGETTWATLIDTSANNYICEQTA